ncbi:hypothetical protein C8R42DRAFT_596913, partial [Lentinula raphanica]
LCCPECYLSLHSDKLYIFLHALRYTTSLSLRDIEMEMPAWSAEGYSWDRSYCLVCTSRLDLV